MSSRIGKLIGRILQQTHLIAVGHILNAPWKSRDARRRQRYRATVGAAMKYLKRYSPYIESIQPAMEPKDNKEPERAFTIWFQGEENAPELVKACFRSMRRNLSQEVVVLDEKTLFDWISLPPEIIEKWKKGKIRPAHFSDICRVELLYRHGGLWFDATDFVTSPVPKLIMDAGFFMFLSGNTIRGSYSFVQNCFIRSRKGNPLLGIWRAAIHKYWGEENSVINYFTHQLLFRLCTESNQTAATLFKEMPKLEQDPTHALWFDHCEDRFDDKTFKELTAGSFFQKTNYKDKRLNNVKKGTVADHILNTK